MASVAFAYHRALAPMMWAFVALASLELFVIHVLVSIWSVRAALVLTALTLVSLVWFVLLIRSFKRLPVLAEADGLLMRSGRLMAVRIPLAQIAGAKTDFASESVKSRSVLNLAMLSYPNLLIELNEPIQRRRRSISHIAHRLDDPPAFIPALKPRLPGATP